jgi:polyphosphate kinase
LDNRAGVERVVAFCTEEESKRSLTLVPGVEQAMVDSRIMLIEYWREVGGDEQARRLESRIDDPLKVWKLSALDLISYSRWYDYARAPNDMLATTDTVWAPWYIAHADDKKRARLNIITHRSVKCPTNPSAARRSPCRTATRPGTTSKPSWRAATSPRRSDQDSRLPTIRAACTDGDRWQAPP